MIKITLAVLCFVNVAIAQDVPTAGSYRDFSGGLNTYNASVALPANESPNLMNVVIDEAGALTQRNGYQSCGQIPSGATATNLYEYVKNDGSRNLIVTDNETIWQTADCVVYSTVTTGLSSLSMPRFTTALDKLWVVNGSTYPFTWDGSTLYRLDGLDNHPEAPKGKFITYWKSRVWIADTPTAPSSVYFSLLVDSLGNILSPETSTGAWTSTNQIYFNRDDGSPVYGMKAYRDNLYVFKETGISRLIFESEYSLSVAKNVSTIGSKFNESIVEMDDGLLRFVGRDGVYAFDGSTVKRLSTRWTPTFETIRQPSQSEQYKLWDSNSDWLTGNFSSVTYKHVAGAITLDYNTSDRLRAKFGETTAAFYPSITFSGDNYFQIQGSPSQSLYYNTPTSIGTKSGYIYVPKDVSPAGVLTTTGTATLSLNIGAGHIGILYKAQAIEHFFLNDSQTIASLNGFSISVDVSISGGDEVGGNVSYTFTSKLNKYIAGNKITISTNTETKTNIYDGGNDYCTFSGSPRIVYTSTSVAITGSGVTGGECGPNVITDIFKHSYSGDVVVKSDYRTGSIDYMYNSIYGPSSLLSYLIYPLSASINFFDPPAFYPAGVYESQITTASNISGWKTFAADETLNGQAISYDIRTATSVYNTLLAPWRPITSGAVVSTTTDNYAQWRATLVTSTDSITPVINSASIGWMTGGSSKSTMYGINYKSRYWLAASTSIANQYNDLAMVESKSPIGTHTRYNLPISAFAIWNGNLYGAIGNTPKIARLDYGSTDDGNAIMSWWDSRDEMYDNPILYKTINLGILDYANSPANTNIQIGLSPDMGENWEYKAFNMAASTLPRNTKRLNYKANTSLGFRTRILNDTLGIGFKIYGIHNFGKMTQFSGN